MVLKRCINILTVNHINNVMSHCTEWDKIRINSYVGIVFRNGVRRFLALSQNHRMVKAVMHLWRSSYLVSVLKQGYLEPADF